MIDTKNLRDLATSLGIGQFNATMVIPYLMIAPATTDPKSAQIILIIRKLQEMLYAMGATAVAQNGRLDNATAAALLRVVGPDWIRRPWSFTITSVLEAQANRVRIDAPDVPAAPIGQPVSMGSPLDFLPDVPGGIVTYGVAGYLLYRYFTKKKARAS